jgi:hypothetical protein
VVRGDRCWEVGLLRGGREVAISARRAATRLSSPKSRRSAPTERPWIVSSFEILGWTPVSHPQKKGQPTNPDRMAGAGRGELQPAITPILALLLDVGFQPGEDLRPASVGVACGWGQTGVRYADGGHALFFIQVEPDKGFQVVSLPAGVPGKFE